MNYTNNQSNLHLNQSQNSEQHIGLANTIKWISITSTILTIIMIIMGIISAIINWPSLFTIGLWISPFVISLNIICAVIIFATKWTSPRAKEEKVLWGMFTILILGFIASWYFSTLPNKTNTPSKTNNQLEKEPDYMISNQSEHFDNPQT